MVGGASIPLRLAGLGARLAAAFNRPDLLLVWDVDGLTAALAGKTGPGHPVHSRQPGFTAALDECLAALGQPRPARAWLSARNVVVGRVDLPVNPDKPRSPEQMAALARGELEHRLAECNAQWTVGAVLAARGALPREQRRAVLDSALASGKGYGLARYGEHALTLGFVTRPDVDEALQVQEDLQNLDADMALDVRPGASLHGHAGWLVCALAASRREAWREALAARRIRLEGILPLAWLLSEPDGREGHDLTLELHPEEALLVEREGGRVHASRIQNLQ